MAGARWQFDHAAQCVDDVPISSSHAMNQALLREKPIRLPDFHRGLADAPDKERWELMGGHILKSMVGARWEHARIVSNLHIGLGQRLRAKGSFCRLFAESFRVEVGEDTSLFPDIMIACTQLPPRATALRTPIVLMEVLSDDARRDHGVKWQHYQTIETLQHYVLVERDAPLLQLFDRSDGSWRVRRLEGVAATLDLPSLDIGMPLSEIYADLFA